MFIVFSQSAVGYDYQEKVVKHESQTDGSKGFGGKFGVQTDRQDAAAVGFDEEQGHVGTTYEKHKPVVAGIQIDIDADLKCHHFLNVPLFVSQRKVKLRY